MSNKNFIVEKDFEYKGLRCVVIFTRMGHRCGYVGIPKLHKLYGKDYDEGFDEENSIECHFDVHGGITYAGESEDYPVKTDDKLWWLGFDTAHCGDGKDIDLSLKYGILDEKTYGILKESENMFGSDSEVKSLEYCIDECKSLAEQLTQTI